MEGNFTETQLNQENASSRNSKLAFEIIRQCIVVGIKDFCLCPGGRNSALIDCLNECILDETINVYFFYEERSAAFFALGCAKKNNRSVAVITTSGTAVGELLPAAMEAFYSEIPLLFITADRPKRFKGSGAPQTAEQEGIFGIYTKYQENIDFNDFFDLKEWDQTFCAHLNVCLEETYNHFFDQRICVNSCDNPKPPLKINFEESFEKLNSFLKRTQKPLILVGTLLEKDRKAVVDFLEVLSAPVYCEGVSGIREDPRLEPLQIRCPQKLTVNLFDGILRLGGVPTLRLWRDLEKKELNVLSISHLPFSGLSWNSVEHVDLSTYLETYSLNLSISKKNLSETRFLDQVSWKKTEAILQANPSAEPSFFYHLSKFIPQNSQIFLGNSLSIRQWDAFACYQNKNFQIWGSRGLNGIDGQISTFLGLCQSKSSNWAILGDLTVLYDLAGPWIINQLPKMNINIVIVNNGGGRIFSKLFKNPQIQNNHNLKFEHFAKLWKLNYLKWPISHGELSDSNVIEFIPDLCATEMIEQELNSV